MTRLHTLEMGGGGLLDCGMYVITIASWAFGTQRPTGVNGYGAISHNGVDVAGCVNLKCVPDRDRIRDAFASSGCLLQAWDESGERSESDLGKLG